MEVLDNKCLNKQTIEASQILHILCGMTAQWHHHPAVLQWKSHEWMLLEYLKDACLECLETRHFKNSLYDNIYHFPNCIPIGSSIEMPSWMGDEAFHASHRSRLLFKGHCDVLVTALKSHLKVKNWAEVKFWLTSNDCSVFISDQLIKKDEFTNEDVKLIEEWLDARDIPISPNFYLQYKWKEDENIPYVWPVTIEKTKNEGNLKKWMEDNANRTHKAVEVDK